MRQATLLHIPRTGGASRRDALAKAANWYCPPHDYRLSQVPRDRLPAMFLRDPVARFISGYDYLLWRGNRATTKRPESQWYAERDFMEIWPTAEALAIDIDAAWDVIQQQSLVFRPQTWWVDAKRDDLFIGHTETLARDFLDLLHITNTQNAPTLPRVNAAPTRSTLTTEARRRIRVKYAEDERLWRKA